MDRVGKCAEPASAMGKVAMVTELPRGAASVFYFGITALLEAGQGGQAEKGDPREIYPSESWSCLKVAEVAMVLRWLPGGGGWTRC